MKALQYILLCIIIEIVVIGTYKTYLKTYQQEMPKGGEIILILLVATYSWLRYEESKDED